MVGEGINHITVAVCAKCGRGFINKFAKNVAIDSQPVWWTTDAEGPRCDGQVLHHDRMKQIERVYGDADKIVKPSDLDII